MFTFSFFVFYGVVHLARAQNAYFAQPRCDDDGDLPEKFEEAFATCQNDLDTIFKVFTHGVYHKLMDNYSSEEEEIHMRSKRGASYPAKEEIAGCMLLCMFRKMKIVDENDIPTVEGLIKNFNDGAKSRSYFLAVTQVVQQCVSQGRNNVNSLDESTAKCHVSYRIFDCIRNEINDYCEGN